MFYQGSTDLMMPGPVKISIVTIVLNDAHAVEQTILSVSRQKYANPEFIIVDGGSSDGTTAIINAHSERISWWVSEKDGGIYDAMNKGLQHATGDWVIFLNAGDLFADDMVLHRVLPERTPDADVIFGDSIADYGRFRVYRTAGSPDDLRKGMFCSHQSMFFSRKLFENKLFRTDLEIVADHEFLIRLQTEGFTFQHIPFPVVTWNTRGISNQRQMKSVVERYKMVKQLVGHSFGGSCYYLLLLLLAAGVQAGYWLLPDNLMKLAIRVVNRKNLVEDDFLTNGNLLK
jgi:putative colanic acid biosynthesis glycosyltransferase